MLNKKKTENISAAKEDAPINLSGESYSKERKKKYIPKLEKSTLNSEIKDIYQEGFSSTDASINSTNKSYLGTKNKKGYRLISNFLKIITAGFLILIAINSVNIYKQSIATKTAVKDKAYEGYERLLEASKSTTKIQFQEAKKEFENAIQTFNEASAGLWFIVEDETIFAKKSSLSNSAKAVLNSGKYFAEAGEYFSEALEELNKIPFYFIAKNDTSNTVPLEPQEDITSILKKGTEKASLALIDIRAARDELEKIDQQLLPEDIKGKFAFAKDKLNQIISVLESMEDNFPAVLKLLGDEKPYQYLVLLQNNAEIRPAGGFIGSYMLFDINKGVIENLKVEDVYTLDNKFKGTIEPPSYLLPIMSSVKFRDSNYSPDFLVSGRKITSVLEKEGGPIVDTVIAVNQSLLEDFLKITGPLQVGTLANKISAENYVPVLTYIIEAKIWGKEDPKHVLKVMVPEFKKAITKTQNVPKIMSILYKAIQEKTLLAYSKDSVIESLFDTLGLSGRIKYTDEKEDFLSVVNYSIGGNKTDPFIEEKIAHQTSIREDGSIVDEITIARTHTFDKAAQNKWNQIWDSFGFDHREIPGYVVDILGRGTNKVLTRVLVPEKSTLIEVTGAKESDVTVNYDEELKKTSFEFKLSVSPQNTSSITLKYKLPFKLDFSPIDTYKLTIQKQPGSAGSVFTKTIELLKGTNNLRPYVYYPEDARINDENKIIYATNLAYDRYFSAAFGK